MIETLITFLALGAFAGTIAGLLGVGGGLIIVPVLALVFTGQEIAPGLVMHLAVGTSLGTIVLTSISSVRAHHRRGAVRWDVFARLAPGIVLGAALGGLVADRLASDSLQIVFGIFELVVAAQMGFSLLPEAHRSLPGRAGMTVAGGVIGAVSAVIGIGGGTLTVPFLVWCRVRMQQAVATSAACGLPIAAAGAASFVVVGWNTPGLPDWSSGYLYWPAWAGVVVTSALFAPLGARLAHAVSAQRLKRFFALFLATLGVWMLGAALV